MNAKDPSLDTLLQLKGLLDSGAVTRQEFNLLKRKLLGNSFVDEPEIKNPEIKSDKQPLSAFHDSAAEETIISPDSPPARQVTIYSAAPPAVERPVAGEDPVSRETITGTSLPGASNPENPAEPPRLDIDHLLVPDETAPSVRSAPVRWAVATSPTSSALPILVPKNGTPMRSERKWKEPVKFAPFAFSLKEQEEKWKKALNVATVLSLLFLAAFGGFLLQNQRGMEPEQISSRTQSAGGLTPPLGENPLGEDEGSAAEDEGSAADAPTDRRAGNSKEVAIRPTSPPEPRKQPPAEPATPPAAPVQEPGKPIGFPVTTAQTPAVPVPETAALGTEREEQQEQLALPEAVDLDSPVPTAPAAEQAAPEPAAEEKIVLEPVGKEEIAPEPVGEERMDPEPAVDPITTLPGRDSYDEFDQAILDEIEDRLRAFYVDFQEKPFDARKFFAPRVERFYTLTNTTPRDINKNLENYHYKEFLDASSSFDPASIRIVSRDDVIYEVVYIEHGRSFRKSRNQHQESTARVRARFNPNFKMTYLRQERLLKNEFYE